MPAEWLSNTSDLGDRVAAASRGVMRGLGDPANQVRLRRGLAALLAVWAIAALARLLWALFPAADDLAEPPPAVINPVVTRQQAAPAQSVDIDRMVAWHLFGEAQELSEEALAAAALQAQEQNSRDGIEEGARETRLDLVLVGIVASTADGLGHAIIEHRREQEVYAVEDKLPVSGQVVLAKIMPDRVVLDNNGTYELLRLYEENELDRQAAAASPPPPPQRAGGPPRAERSREVRADAGATQLASAYRERLYRNPQSLAQVVQVAAVREGGELRGYRVSPGRDAAQFQRLGFRPGDLVTAVNGIALDDPSNTMRLYQAMRTASEAVFDLRRGDEQVTLSVNLTDSGDHGDY